MERLTFEGNFCDIAKCEGDPGFTSECPNGYCDQRRVWERLKWYEDAEQEGRLVVLPCKVGDTVYQLDYMTHSEALKSGVPRDDSRSKRKYMRKHAKYLPLIVREKKMVKSLYREIGKTVFLTREEADAEFERIVGGESK